MKKFTIASAILCTTIIFSYCKKENIQQSRMANTLVDKANPSMSDFILEPHKSNKSNLGQADIN